MKLSIAKDFSIIPGARFPEEGDFSGQDFRTQLLLPKLLDAIQKDEILFVILDGTAGLGTSFLEEAFGGLIREDKVDYNQIKSHLKFVSEEDPEYVDEINEYMEDAYAQSIGK